MNVAYRTGIGGFAVPIGPLPAGRHSLTRDAVLASQRGRLLDAMATAVAEHGYGGAAVARVVSGAGVSRKTFYEHFRDKEECFLALYDTAIGYVLGRIVERIGDDTGDEPRVRVATGLEAFLGVLAEEPVMSRAIILEVHAAGPRALARRRAALGVFAQRYQELSDGRLSGDVALALVGGVLETVSARIEAGRAAELPDLLGPLTDFVAGHVVPGEER